MFRFKSRGLRKTFRVGILLDLSYSGDKSKAVLHFMDINTQKYFKWTDNSNHVSYCLTNATEEQAHEILKNDIDFIGTEQVTKYDSIQDKDVILTKVKAIDPNAIGGQSSRERRENYRDMLDRNGFSVWEGRIVYVNNFCYDMGYEVGMTYKVYKDKIVPHEREDVIVNRTKIFNEITSKVPPSDTLNHWIRMAEEPVPPYRYAAVDIEVLPETPTTMPNAINATQPVIAASIIGSDGRREILLLRRVGTSMGSGDFDGDVTMFDKEEDLLITLFGIVTLYPFIITFNGDNFDLMYLYNRSIRLSLDERLSPVYVRRKILKLKTGVHIDLYPFMKNPSIQGYAFREKYKNFGLDDVAMGLLGKGKIKNDKYIESLTYVELANYCINDGVLTYELVTFGDNAVLNLIIALVRMSNLSIYQITRNQISDWIKSMMYYMMRKKNWLIPNEKELLSRGSIESTAKVKGKGYEGAIVLEPKSGVFFNVIVMDFASLYPSQVKFRNIGFSSINCSHSECQDNIVPGLNHHICIKNKAIESDIIGGLRDIRVFYYKKEAKNKDNPKSAFYMIFEQAIKVYLNASYGVFGSKNFVLFSPPVAECIAAYSRFVLRSIIDKAHEIQINPLYSDTDSLFLDNPTIRQTNILKDYSREELNMDLDVDKVYKYALFSTRKKNYLGVYKDGTVDIKGLTGKKKQVPLIIKNPFYEILDILSKVDNMDDYFKAREKVWSISVKSYKKLVNKEWELSDLVYNVRLSRDVEQYTVNAQHVKVAKLLQESGQQVRGGDNVEFIKSVTEEGVMPLISAEKKLVDTDSYLKELGSALSQILDAMDIDWSTVKGETRLDMFFGDTPFKLSDFMKPRAK